MKNSLSVEISYNKVPISRGLTRYVQRSISEWADYQPIEIAPGGTTFEVKFDRVGKGHQFDCYTSVASRFGRWFAIAWGKSPQEAFRNCLNQLR